jgi:hypothetical protein
MALGFYKGITRVLRRYYKGVTRVLQGRYKGVTRVLVGLVGSVGSVGLVGLVSLPEPEGVQKVVQGGVCTRDIPGTSMLV